MDTNGRHDLLSLLLAASRPYPAEEIVSAAIRTAAYVYREQFGNSDAILHKMLDDALRDYHPIVQQEPKNGEND